MAKAIRRIASRPRQVLCGSSRNEGGWLEVTPLPSSIAHTQVARLPAGLRPRPAACPDGLSDGALNEPAPCDRIYFQGTDHEGVELQHLIPAVLIFIVLAGPPPAWGKERVARRSLIAHPVAIQLSTEGGDTFAEAGLAADLSRARRAPDRGTRWTVGSSAMPQEELRRWR